MCWWIFNLFHAIQSCGMSNMGWGPTGGVCLCLTSRALPGLAFRKDCCCPQSSAHAGQHPLSLSNRRCSWDEAAGLRRRQPHPSQPAQLSSYPWFSSRCAVLRSKLHQAKRLAPCSPQVKLLGRQYQTQLCHSRAHHHQHQVTELSQLLKSNPRQVLATNTPSSYALASGAAGLDSLGQLSY